jgi:type I restriction enzyme, S subunit
MTISHTNLSPNEYLWRDCDIADLCQLQRGFDITEITRRPGTIPVYSSSGLSYFHDEAKVQSPVVITGRKGILGKVFFVEEDCWPHDTTLWVTDFKGNDPEFVSIFLRQFKLERFDAATSVPTLNRNNLVGIPIRLPPHGEQQAIAKVLRDTDALMAALEALVAKKRAIKQGAMQELLTGQRRLPGFRGEWEIRKIGEIAVLQRGFDLPNSSLKSGPYPVIYSNGALTYHCERQVFGPGVVTGRSGTIGSVFFTEKDFWPHNTTLWVKDFRGNDRRYVYFLLRFLDLSRYSSGSGVPTLNRNDVHGGEAMIPTDPREQRAIATVLSDMDAEIDALDAKLAKARDIKQDMMQALLTGEVRLV